MTMDSDDFQRIGNGMIRPQEKFIETFECECGEQVDKKEMVIPLGPRKGEKVVVNVGCKCEDIELARKTIEDRDRAKAMQIQRYFNNQSLINDSLQKATLANYEPTSDELARAKDSATKYVKGFEGSGNLLLHGSYGTGKSHLSIAITKELMERGKTCLFLSLPKLYTKIRDTYGNGEITEDRMLNAIKQVDLLVLDDIGADQKTDWGTAKLFEIMDSRAGKSTIYTTNLDSKQLAKHIGNRNFSRLLENTKIIIMNGDDYRRKEF